MKYELTQQVTLNEKNWRKILRALAHNPASTEYHTKCVLAAAPTARIDCNRIEIVQSFIHSHLDWDYLMETPTIMVESHHARLYHIKRVRRQGDVLLTLSHHGLVSGQNGHFTIKGGSWHIVSTWTTEIAAILSGEWIGHVTMNKGGRQATHDTRGTDIPSIMEALLNLQLSLQREAAAAV